MRTLHRILVHVHERTRGDGGDGGDGVDVLGLPRLPTCIQFTCESSQHDRTLQSVSFACVVFDTR